MTATTTSRPTIISRQDFERVCKDLSVHLTVGERVILQSISKDDSLFSTDVADVEKRAQKYEGKRAADARSARQTWERRKLKESRAHRKAECTKIKDKCDRSSTGCGTDAYSRWRATLQSNMYYSHNLSREMPRQKP